MADTPRKAKPTYNHKLARRGRRLGHQTMDKKVAERANKKRDR